MSNYQFAPAVVHHQLHPFVTWADAFSKEELDRICAYCDTLPLTTAGVGGDNSPNTDIRRTSVGWINCNPETGWLYDRLAYVARQLNAKFYGFDLYGFLEDIQYTVYEADDSGFYGWHVDMSEQTPAQRKLSLVLQLSDPDDYDGGDLQTHVNTVNPTVVDKQRGLIAAFPSWALHRVTPVTRGVRKTLVVWTAGPCFK